MSKEQKNKSKTIGQIFTPQYIVESILDYAGYCGIGILGKHIIDNSCGDGAFLKIVVTRYCKEAMLLKKSSEEIKRELECYIHGIDTDEVAYNQCRENLSSIANGFGIKDVQWDLYHQSSLSMNKFNGKMDFVVGNPPYVRVHNLDSVYDEVKQYKFAKGGMTDLYLAFFELGFNMLNSSGRLCYITPSSWLNSLAAANMRLYLLHEQNLVSLTDLEHFQAFEHATTYTIISLFDKQKKDKEFDYYVFNGNTHKREFVDRIAIDECYIDSSFYLADRRNLQIVKDIKTTKSSKYVSVKNGFATLADSVFIGNEICESAITIKALKASTGKWYNCLFPYDNKGKLLPSEVVLANQKVKEHFESYKDKLLKGKPYYPKYYAYGRAQALRDVWNDKIAINNLLRTENDLKIAQVKCGEGVYSGFYIISKVNIPFEDIKNILVSQEFVSYIRLLKKYKSGGYYTFNTKDVEQYINYYLNT